MRSMPRRKELGIDAAPLLPSGIRMMWAWKLSEKLGNQLKKKKETVQTEFRDYVWWKYYRDLRSTVRQLAAAAARSSN